MAPGASIKIGEPAQIIGLDDAPVTTAKVIKKDGAITRFATADGVYSAKPTPPILASKINRGTAINENKKVSKSIEQFLFSDSTINEEFAFNIVRHQNKVALQESKQVIKQMAIAKLKRDRLK
jgi:hypothetical protein